MKGIDIFPWNENFNTGIAIIDEQHKVLVQLLNQLASLVAFNNDQIKLNKVFDELAEYASYHFKTEEAIWGKYLETDDSFSSHLAIHESFVHEVLKIKSTQNESSIEKVAEEILSFLARWLAAHILESDRQMAYVVIAIESGLSLNDAKIKGKEQMGGATKVLIQIILSIYNSLSTNTLQLMRELYEKRQNEKILLNAKLQAEAANLAKSHFLSNVSHEVRTPLNGILGMAQLLLAYPSSESERIKYTQEIINSGGRLLELMSHVLDVSNIESGNFEIKKIQTDIGKLVQEVIDPVMEVINKKNLKLEVDISGVKSLECHCDQIRVKQMLKNLLSNAIRFTEKGTIKIEAKEIERNEHNAMLKFSVSDTGVGILAENIHLLFRPFSQIDNTKTRSFQGAGLGLSIVRTFAEFMGGTAGVQSEFGQGSVIWFTIRIDL